MRRRSIVIVGGGVAGLYAATALAQRGASVTVLERAEAMGEVGAGLQLSANATRLLERIGVGHHALGGATVAERVEMRDGESGAVWMQVRLGDRGRRRWGAPYWQIHRADLHGALLAAARESGVAIRLGENTDRITEEGAVLLENGGAVEADAALGADGLRSRSRAGLFGAAEPSYSGFACWRATIPTEGLPASLTAPQATVWTGPGRHLVAYPLRDASEINLVAVSERPETAPERWREEGDVAELRARYAGWRPEAQTLLERVERCLLWGLYGRPTPSDWHKGAAALLGDAAHPTTPFMAQGAGMGLEDGAALARLLPEAEDIPAALAAYSAARAPRAQRLVAMAMENVHAFHMTGARRALLTGLPGKLALPLARAVAEKRLDSVYGHVEPA